jgi:hypothetical protein
MSPRIRKRNQHAVSRNFERFPHLRELSLFYEGRTEIVPVRPPDISTAGMFVNTPARFPEGAILKLQFRLARSGYEVHTRAEVRFCLPGVGIGIEFLNLLSEDVQAIEEEIIESVR